jgi:L-rhamnonate dehydratase
MRLYRLRHAVGSNILDQYPIFQTIAQTGAAGKAVMKITGIEVIELRVPGWTGATFDGSYDNCVILVHTDAGVTGIAEVDSVPSVIMAIINAPRSHTHAMGLKEVLIGQDPLQVESLWDRMYDWTSYYGRRGVVIHAISGIDIALWDIRGKVEGKPVADLLGSRQRNRLLAYGTVYPLGETPVEVRRNIDRGLRLGLKAIKIVADPHWRQDVRKAEAIIRTAREHVGPDIRLMVDAATAWEKAEDGLPLMPIFRDNNFLWVEAPLPIDDLEGHARFQGFGVPIGGGDLGLTTRYEYEHAFEVGKIDIAQPDVTMSGGLTELMRIAAVAKKRGKRVVTHGYKSNITIAANLAFLSQHWDDEPAEYSTSESPLRWNLTREKFDIGVDGRIQVPEQPGLGVSLDSAVIEKYRIG